LHPEAFDYVERTVLELGPWRRVIEIGGRNVNGTVRPLFGHADYTSLDLAEGPGVDVVADAAVWSPAGALADCVVCCEVLEHAANASDIVVNAHRWLHPGGVFIATMATDPRAPHSAVDGGSLPPGEFYCNIAPAALDGMLSAAGFAEWSIVVQGGDLYATAWA
jgi:hypothetical protein